MKNYYSEFLNKNVEFSPQPKGLPKLTEGDQGEERRPSDSFGSVVDIGANLPKQSDSNMDDGDDELNGAPQSRIHQPNAIDVFHEKLDRGRRDLSLTTTTGMRLGEYLALRWSDIDFYRSVL